MQVKRKIRIIRQTPGKLAHRLQLKARALHNRMQILFDLGVAATIRAAELHQKKVRQRGERISKTWDFGYAHGLFAAEDGYYTLEPRPEAELPHRYADQLAELNAWKTSGLDGLTTGRSLAKYPTKSNPAENIAGIDPIVVIEQPDSNVAPGTPTTDMMAQQAEIDGLPGKAARLRGATEEEARAVESEVEREARKNRKRASKKLAKWAAKRI